MRFTSRSGRAVGRALLALSVAFVLCVLPSFAGKGKFTDSFQTGTCSFLDTGSNPYFVLEPGWELVLEGMEKKKTVVLTITVMNTTEVVDGVVTRVVEEREVHDGNLVEVSLNYFAICDRTNSVFYFGEDVDNYDNQGNLTDHKGSWRAGINGATPGIIMPGDLLLGARYAQEVAPGIALDRAQIKSISETAATPAGTFSDCLKTKETSGIEKNAKEFKLMCPGIGVVQDETLMLTSYGFAF